MFYKFIKLSGGEMLHLSSHQGLQHSRLIEIVNALDKRLNLGHVTQDPS